MIATFGQYALAAATFITAAAALSALAAIRLGDDRCLRAGRWLMGVFAVLISLASAILMVALLRDDFTLAYVVSYSERAMPLGYKIAAFWAGQEGSLLLWTLLLAVMSLIVVIRLRRDRGVDPAATVIILAVVCGFFTSLMLFADSRDPMTGQITDSANPFTAMPVAVEDGRGLNPLLQDPAMIAHPPILFVGYAGLTIPFAIFVGAMAAGRKDAKWIDRIHGWLLISWLMLTAGIVLGAEWAYVELGWGGYWAWDPVENASLLPWFAATALLHSIVIHRQRGMMKWWNGLLIPGAFILCIFGTYLTRSGVIQSVHSFGKSPIGTFFLMFMLIVVAATAALLIWRRSLLRAENSMPALISREGLFLGAVWLLVVMLAVTLVGTIWPLISAPIVAVFPGWRNTVGPEFYNIVVLPIAMVLAGLMTLGPVLPYGPTPMRQLLRRLAAPWVIAALAVAWCVWRGWTDPWALACAFIATFGISVVLEGFVRGALSFSRESGQGIVAAAVRMVDANHRRYAAQVAHVGLLLIIIGVTGSGVYGIEQKLKFRPHQTIEFAGHQLKVEKLHTVHGANYSALEAVVSVQTSDGRSMTMRPQRRMYPKFDQPNAEIAMRTNLAGDLYLALSGSDDDGLTIGLLALYSPLVMWIWIGGTVLVLGAFWGMLPRLLPNAHAPITVRPVSDAGVQAAVPSPAGALAVPKTTETES